MLLILGMLVAINYNKEGMMEVNINSLLKQGEECYKPVAIDVENNSVVLGKVHVDALEFIENKAVVYRTIMQSLVAYALHDIHEYFTVVGQIR